MDELSGEHAAIYDRQIRLWGVESQKRMIKSRVLVAGMTGLGCEISKNLILAGVGNLDILDDSVVSIRDLDAQFFLSSTDLHVATRAQASEAKLQALNPLSKVTALPISLSSFGLVQIRDYQVVCLVDAPFRERLRISALCREHGICFMAAASTGLIGTFFQDVGDNFEYSTEKDPSPKTISTVAFAHAANLPAARMQRPSKVLLVQKLFDEYERLEHHEYAPEHEFLAWKHTFCKDHRISEELLDDDFVRHVLKWRASHVEFAPVCAVVGGFAAQEIVKMISRRDAPIHNMFTYDGMDTSGGFIETLQ
jgi:ubiquitin-like 1-activating enzyme E1 A